MNEAAGTDLSSENHETIGGLLIDELGEIPREGAQDLPTIRVGNCEFVIESVRDRRIESVRMRVIPPEEEGEGEGKTE